MIQLQQIISTLEHEAPFSLQESYDNSGLLTGNPSMEISGALLTLDVTEAVLEEAKANHCNLIIAHHPILFTGLKKLTGSSYVERILIKAIKEEIAILAVHTNLDNVKQGVNQLIADKLSLIHTRILSPTAENLLQLYTYIPSSHAESVKMALFEAGAGRVGLYEHCSFSFPGVGTYKPLSGAEPFLGRVGEESKENETRMEVIFPAHRKAQVLKALRSSHPYEEIAYGVLDIGLKNPETGAGMFGELPAEMPVEDFLLHLKKVMKCDVIKHTRAVKPTLLKVALCGGSGYFLLPQAIQQKADIFITSDVKYHQFFDADNHLILADIGHYESEQFTPEIFYRVLREKFPTFALQISSVNTNPVNYL